jgi:hypothetical protein
VPPCYLASHGDKLLLEFSDIKPFGINYGRYFTLKVIASFSAGGNIFLYSCTIQEFFPA